MIMGVAIDEMKHLFIVSNLCNAIGMDPPYPTPDSENDDSVPKFPSSPPKVLNFSDRH